LLHCSVDQLSGKEDHSLLDQCNNQFTTTDLILVKWGDTLAKNVG